METTLIVIAAIALLALGVYGWIRWTRVFDGPDGERYRRRRAQGPFAGVDDPHDDRGGRHPRPDPRDQGP